MIAVVNWFEELRRKQSSPKQLSRGSSQACRKETQSWGRTLLTPLCAYQAHDVIPCCQ